MTIATGFLAKSATVAGVACAGLTTLGFSQGGQAVDLRSDGELFAQKIPIIPSNWDLEIETRDLAVLGSIESGTTGSLSLATDKMTGGKTLSGTLTFTSTTVTVRSVSGGTDINGQAVVRIGATVNSANGSSSGLTVTAA
jgi:hypothetical protein